MELTQQVILAKQGDRDAFIRLMKHVESPLHNTAKSILKKDEDVADALQETILLAYKSLPSLREPSFFKTWIFRILINACKKIAASRSRNVSMADIPVVQSFSPEYEDVDLKEAVDRLEEQQRMVVVLFYFEDMPLRQVAEVLEISESAAKMRLSRARKTLLDHLMPIGKGAMNYGSI
ncbi:RNA polymerase sigma factor [Brevibacillus choshinensis]|uniref:Sigma-70 family RNA polymerase sigma factor n=1 Tax=Brevibacillus choshinensis TaxID=54911 RepID=A0ABX7FS21_BRECH|nr:sigma-70 family RNA polymerase sigma factor [Brevibacillus choshinensis]QRG68528.1 sigma-70 family RNA polymerase sigma factor [Brevibacillus choshinensis]